MTADAPLLIILRGNSGSGKSTVAAGLRAAYGRGIAVLPQDVVRREILRERDLPDAVNVGLLAAMAKHILEQGVHVVLEGILYADHYGDAIESLRHGHEGPTSGWYFKIPYEVTVDRHGTKPNSGDWTPDDMRAWYRDNDVLPGDFEQIIGPESRADETVARILAETNLLAAPRPPHPGFAEAPRRVGA